MLNFSREVCISAVSEQQLVHEYVVKLFALFGCVVRGFVVFLLFVASVGQRRLVLDCPVSEALVSAVLLCECVSSDVFGIDCFCFVVCSAWRVEVSADQNVCVYVCSSSCTCQCASGARSTLVARARLRIPCEGSILVRLAV